MLGVKKIFEAYAYDKMVKVSADPYVSWALYPFVKSGQLMTHHNGHVPSKFEGLVSV